MRYHAVNAIDEKGAETGQLIAQVFGAGLDGVRVVMNAPIETGDGRSEYVWLRLQNGDLVLGLYPQGDTYMEIERLVDRDYHVALEESRIRMTRDYNVEASRLLDGDHELEGISNFGDEIADNCGVCGFAVGWRNDRPARPAHATLASVEDVKGWIERSKDMSLNRSLNEGRIQPDDDDENEGRPSDSERLEHLRGEIRAERISMDELLELQDFGERGVIDAGDVELLEWAGVPEEDVRSGRYPAAYPQTNPKWDDNLIQFARLLCEIRATQHAFDINALCESMDLNERDIDELFDRADDVWESAKENVWQRATSEGEA